MTIGETVKYEGTTVKLGGRDWVFAPLPPRRYRITVPLVCSLLTDIGTLVSAFQPKPVVEGEEAKPLDFTSLLVSFSDAFSEEMIDNLSKVFYLTLLRNYPEMTEDEWYEETPVTLMEMVTNFMVVAQMSGIMPAGGKKEKKGEGIAGT